MFVIKLGTSATNNAETIHSWVFLGCVSLSDKSTQHNDLVKVIWYVLYYILEDEGKVCPTNKHHVGNVEISPIIGCCQHILMATLRPLMP